jgi:hypothetical protein
VETLQSQYVHDDKLSHHGYEAARAITPLMYEIGRNSKVGEEEDEESGYSSDKTIERVGRSRTDTKEDGQTLEVYKVAGKLKLPSWDEHGIRFKLLDFCEEFGGFWTYGDLPFYTTVIPDDEYDSKGHVLHVEVSFGTRPIAKSFLEKLSQLNRSTTSPLRRKVDIRDEIEQCWVDPSNSRFGVHAKVFRSRSVLPGCVPEFAHVGPMGDSSSDSGSIDVWCGCCWDRSDFEYVEELEAQYVHDDKLCLGYETARAITALMYEIGGNGKLPEEEAAVECGEEGEAARTGRVGINSAQRQSPVRPCIRFVYRWTC